MFGETTIFYKKIWNHPIEATIYKWLFRVPGCGCIFLKKRVTTKLVREASFASKMPCHKHRSCCIFVLMMLNGHCSYLENGDSWNFKIDGLLSLKLTANPALANQWDWFGSDDSWCFWGKRPVFRREKTPFFHLKKKSEDPNFRLSTPTSPTEATWDHGKRSGKAGGKTLVESKSNKGGVFRP